MDSPKRAAVAALEAVAAVPASPRAVVVAMVLAMAVAEA